MTSVTVLGAGAWGTAVATVLAENGYQVKLWCYEKEVAEDIVKTGYNTHYLPNILLSKNIVATHDLAKALVDATWIFEAIPIKFLRTILLQAKPYITSEQKWVVLSKGIENDTFFLPAQIIKDICGDVSVAALSGPNFAKDLAEKALSATTLASVDCSTVQELQEVVANDYFRPYLSYDINGVQVSGALKNALTVGVGLLKGAGYKENTIAAFVTEGLREVSLLINYYGGKPETVYGLSGLGDFILTAFGSQSRNLKVGTMIGEGMSLDEVLTKTGYIPEGINTIESLHQIILKSNLPMPTYAGIYEIIFEKRSIESFMQDLWSRPLSHECLNL